MAIRNRTTNLTGYGLDNALQSLAPQPIQANRAPTTSDTAPVGTLWCFPANLEVWINDGIVNGSSQWVLVETSGGPGIFSSLTVNPGPTLLDGQVTIVAGNNPVHISTTDNVASAIEISTNGGTSETIQITNNQGTGQDAIDIVSVAGGIGITTAAGDIIIGTVHNAAGAIQLVTDGGTSETIEITNTLGTSPASIYLESIAGGVLIDAALDTASAIVLTTTNAAGGVTVDTGTNGFTVLTANGPISLSSGSADIDISDDAQPTTINIGTGNAVKSVLIGSTNTTSETFITAGTGEIILATGTDNATAGFISMLPSDGTEASGGSDTVTVDSRFISAVFTGYTTLNNGGIQLLIVESSEILTTSSILATATNLNASGNAAVIGIQGIAQETGALNIVVVNNGAGALGTGDDIIITVWVLN